MTKSFGMQNSNYENMLNTMWGKHIAGREASAPTVISLFAGCGGSSLGYSFAGFKELLAVDWNKAALTTFGINFTNVPVYCGDIKNLSAEQCLNMANIKCGQLDVLDGSPPCQGFSMAGSRNLSDKRNELFMEYSRLLLGIKPRVFIMENVSGMVIGKMKSVFADAVRTLRGCGYNVSARLMNAAYFFVPQNRWRIIFVGVRNDFLVAPSHPLPQSKLISAEDVCDDFKDATFLTWRGKNKNDTLSRVNSPSPSITRSGIDLPGRKLYKDINGIKILSSFPGQFQLSGTGPEQLSQIGNCVPPMFMYEIARHVRTEMLDKML
jgi:DNA (cytosine-5)-methyltransferase 1